MKETKKDTSPRVEVYAAMQLARKLFPRRKVLNKMKAFGAWKVSSSQTVVEDEKGHKETLWTRTFLMA